MLIDYNEVIHNQKRVKSLQDAIFRNHTTYCGFNASCVLCQSFSDDIKENIRVFYLYLKKDQTNNCLVEELVKLFYYRINKKLFKYLRYFYYLNRKYKSNKNYRRNIRMISELWLRKETDNHYELIPFLLEVNQLENQVNTLLLKINNFFTQHISLKTAETAIHLSYELSTIVVLLKNIMSKYNKISGLFAVLNHMMRTLSGTINYTILLLRYIVETLSNQPLDTIFSLNIAILEETFNNHYNSDQILICSLDLSETYRRAINIIKVTGSLIDQHDKDKIQTLCEFFPKEIKHEGVHKFHDLINSKEIKKGERLTFSYPFIKNDMIDFLDYTFDLTKIPKSPTIIVFGQFSLKKNTTLLLNLSHPKIKILGFCRELLRLIYFKRQWLLYFKKLHHDLFLTDIFQEIKQEKNEKVIQCDFKASSFCQQYKIYYKALSTLNEFNKDSTNQNFFNESLRKIHNYNDNVIKITLEKIMEFSEGKCLFNMTVIINSNDICESIKENSGESLKNNDDYNQDMYFNIHSTSCSAATSLSKTRSLLSNSTSKKILNNESLILDVDLQKKIIIETKKLSFFRLIMLLFNIILIIISIIFLYTQINSNKQLSDLSTLYFQFKGIRWIIPNFFLSLLSTICFTSSPIPTNECQNPYVDYNNDFHNKYPLPKHIDLLKYLISELKCKAEYVQGTLNSFKRLLYSSQKDEFQSLLYNYMEYYEFDEDKGTNHLLATNITFEEGLRKYINTILILTNNNQIASYQLTPIYFMGFENNTFLFNQLIAAGLNKLQKEIYKILTNYINFFYSFSQGDLVIKTKLNLLGSSNNSMNYVFMIIIALCNLLLLYLCYINIITAYDIFKVLICHLIVQLEKNVLLQQLKLKIMNLIILGKLYKKNPNYIKRKSIILILIFWFQKKLNLIM